MKPTKSEKTPKNVAQPKVKGTSQNEIALTLAQRHGKTFRFDSESNEWRTYKDGMWSRTKNLSVQTAIQNSLNEFLNGEYTYNFLAGVQKLLMGYVATSKFDNAVCPDHIPLQNGVLNLKTRELLPHSPEFLLTWQLPYRYEPEATCQPILDWLSWACGDDSTVELIRAFFYAVLTGRSDLQRFLEIDGPGGTGKGTLLRLLVDLLGERNVYSTEVDQLEKNRFETAAIQGKRLVMLTDAKDYGGEGNVLKALTGQDWLRKEKKNKQQEEPFVFGGLVVVAANRPITFKDTSSAIPRRRISISFDRVAPVNERRDLSTEFRPLIPGLLNWVLSIDPVEAVSLLRDTENLCSNANSAKKETLIESNSMIAWLSTNIEYSGKGRTKVGMLGTGAERLESANQWLYPNYVRFCEKSGLSKPKSHVKFSKDLDDVLKNTLGLKGVGRQSRSGDGNHFVGIEIAENTNFSVVDFAFAETTESPSNMPLTGENKPNEIFVQSLLDAIAEECPLTPSNMREVKQLLLNYDGDNLSKTAEQFIKLFHIGIKSLKNPEESTDDAVEWLNDLVNGIVPF